MTITRNGGEGTDGTTVSVANSGGASGTAWSAVTLNTGDIEYDTAQFSGGASSLLVQPLSSVVSEVRRTFDASSTQAQVSFYFRTPSAFTVSSTICQLRNATAAAVSIQFTTSSKLRVMNAAGTQVHLTTASLSNDTWYRVEARAVMGSTTSNGTIEFAFYAGDNASPVETAYTPGATVNSGISEYANVRYGRTSAATADTTNYWLDNFQELTGADATALSVPWPAPLAAGGGPLVWTGADWE